MRLNDGGLYMQAVGSTHSGLLVLLVEFTYLLLNLLDTRSCLHYPCLSSFYVALYLFYDHLGISLSKKAGVQVRLPSSNFAVWRSFCWVFNATECFCKALFCLAISA